MIGREAGLDDHDVDSLQQVRDKTPPQPISFE
jgi:hypothetical protein